MYILNQLEKSKFTRIVSIIILLSFIFFSVKFRNGGTLHPESQSFILNYLDNRPIYQKVFDIQKNDWGYYQGRELSYFFDMIDAYFIKTSINLGLPHFYSLTFYAGLMIILVILYLIYFKLLKYRSLILFTLTVALFLSSPAVFFSGIFFRTAKILTGVILTFMVFAIIKFLLNQPSLSDLKTFLLSFGITSLGILISLVDRQGFFLLLALNLIFLLLAIFHQKKQYLALFILLSISTVISSFYTYFLGPSLIYFFTGIKPNLTFLKPDLLTFTRQDPLPEISPYQLKILTVIKRSILLVIDSVGYFSGNLNPILALCLIIIAFYLVMRLQKKYFFLILLSFFLLVFMAFYMLIKQPQLVWPGVRRGGYILPTSLVILFFALIIGNKIYIVWPKFRIYLVILLTAALFSNTLSIPYHYSAIKGGIYSDEHFIYEYSPRLLQCLKNKNTPLKNFRLPHNIEKICNQLRYRPPNQSSK